jgi:hypothetical protein
MFVRLGYIVAYDPVDRTLSDHKSWDSPAMHRAPLSLLSVQKGMTRSQSFTSRFDNLSKMCCWAGREWHNSVLDLTSR